MPDLGDAPPETPTIRVVQFPPDGPRSAVPGASLSDPAWMARPGWFWLDIEGMDEATAATLARLFDLDRPTRDDLVEPQYPKFDDLDTHQVVVVHALAADPHAIRTVEVDCVIGPHWLLTVRHEPLRSIEFLHERVLRSAFACDGPDHLAYRLFELVGERYLPLLDDIDAQVLDLEDEAVEANPTVLPDIQALRRDIALLRRVLGPQRRTLDIVARRLVGRSDRAGRDLADALDHHVHVTEALDTAHQMVATVLDTYRGAAAEKMNETMKVLTVFSAIFMPLTLIAGIYGMNFQHIPELEQPWGYGATIASMAVIGSVLWVYFVRRGFIGGPRLRDIARPARVAGRVGRGLAAAAALPVRAATRVTIPVDRQRHDPE